MALLCSLLGLWMILAAEFGPPASEKSGFAIGGSILIASSLLVFVMDDQKQNK
jgi:hypothetical protein